MIRTACLRALVIAPLALSSLFGAKAFADQPNPAAGRSDSEAASATIKSASETDKADKHDIKIAPQKPNGSKGMSSPYQTPAQVKYGMPKTPVLGGQVDTDLSKSLWDSTILASLPAAPS